MPACACASTEAPSTRSAPASASAATWLRSCFPGPVGFLFDFRQRCRLDAIRFRGGSVLGFIDYLCGSPVGGINDTRRFRLGLAQPLNGFFLGELKVVAGLIGRRQALGDLLLTLLHGSQYGRPHILHAEDDKRHEGQHLADEGEIDIHDLLLALV